MKAGIVTHPEYINDELCHIIKRSGGLFALKTELGDGLIRFVNSIIARIAWNRDYAAKNLYTEKQRPISFAILGSSELNALCYASPDGSFDFFGVNVGVFLTLNDIFSRLLSHPAFLPHIGDPSLEREDRTFIPFVYSNVVAQNNSVGVNPNCKIRRIFSNCMFFTALDFIVFHEMYHLRNGHLEWKRARGEGIAHCETIGERNSVSGLHFQALEMDADCGAVRATINTAYDIVKQAPGNYPDETMHAGRQVAYGSIKTMVPLVAHSIYTLFRLFDCKEWDVFHQHEFTHPQSPLRQHWMLLTMQELLKVHDEEEYSADQKNDDLWNTISVVERGIASILNDNVDARGIKSVVTSELANEHLIAVKQAWASVRNDLLPFKRGGILAPA